MTEIWEDIQGYEGLYQVSNLGNVKRIEHEDYRCRQGYRVFKERLLKPFKNHKGYMKVGLSKNNKTKMLFVHRIVAETFLDNPNNYPQINHKDENKTNNTIDNLEWCTNIYNVNYGTRNERASYSIRTTKRKGKE